jgi:hypothetical protein
VDVCAPVFAAALGVRSGAHVRVCLLRADGHCRIREYAPGLHLR